MALRLAASVPRAIFRSTLPSVTRLCKFSAEAQVCIMTITTLGYLTVICKLKIFNFSEQHVNVCSC